MQMTYRSICLALGLAMSPTAKVCRVEPVTVAGFRQKGRQNEPINLVDSRRTETATGRGVEKLQRSRLTVEHAGGSVSNRGRSSVVLHKRSIGFEWLRGEPLCNSDRHRNCQSVSVGSWCSQTRGEVGGVANVAEIAELD